MKRAELTALAETYGFGWIASQLRTLNQELPGIVAFVGDFGASKSTLINGMLRQPRGPMTQTRCCSSAVVLCLLLSTVACTQGDGDGEPPEGTSPSPEPASLTLSPSDVQAGSVRDIDIALDNFGEVEVFVELQDASTDVIYMGHVASTEDGLTARFFFGLLGDGEALWGLDSGEDSASDTFHIEAVDSPAGLGEGLAADDGTLAEPGDFAAWALSALGGQLLLVRARDLGSTDFEPRMWLLTEDGSTRVPTCCDSGEEHILALLPEEDTNYFLRLDDAQGAGGADFSFVVDQATVEVGDPVELAEAEPNDSVAQAHDLGALGLGQWTLSGEVTSGGEDGKFGKFGGDLELFAFTLEQEAFVSMSLAWDNQSDDLDVVLFDGANDEITLSFDSKSVVDTSMATAAPVERATLLLEADRSYVLLVTSFMDAGPSAWTLDLAVAPSAFPEGSR